MNSKRGGDIGGGDVTAQMMQMHLGIEAAKRQ